MNRPLTCKCHWVTLLSVYCLGSPQGHLLRAQDTAVFKNSRSLKIQQERQNQSQGPETVASLHLSGSVQDFRKRKLGLPGHSFC